MHTLHSLNLCNPKASEERWRLPWLACQGEEEARSWGVGCSYTFMIPLKFSDDDDLAVAAHTHIIHYNMFQFF